MIGWILTQYEYANEENHHISALTLPACCLVLHNTTLSHDKHATQDKARTKRWTTT